MKRGATAPQAEAVSSSASQLTIGSPPRREEVPVAPTGKVKCRQQSHRVKERLLVAQANAFALRLQIYKI